jgi:hypothetical protein
MSHIRSQMKTVQQMQEADLAPSLQHKIGEQLRAMYTDEANQRLPPRLLELLADFEQVETRKLPSNPIAGST